MKLRGLQNVDGNAGRFIRKLLVKDPVERWSSHKALHSQFFRIMDDTTKMAASPTAVAAAMHNISCECAMSLCVHLDITVASVTLFWCGWVSFQ